jgi:hypothetical protein
MGWYLPGDFIKAEFKDERSGESEWMWVRVERSDDAERFGKGRSCHPVHFQPVDVNGLGE